MEDTPTGRSAFGASPIYPILDSLNCKAVVNPMPKADVTLRRIPYERVYRFETFLKYWDGNIESNTRT